MPIDYSKYHKHWKIISAYVRKVRAEDRCEGSPGIYPECSAKNGAPHPVTHSKVVLTVAHLDHNIDNNELWNLQAMCQRCHLAYDREDNRRKIAKKKREAQLAEGQMIFRFVDVLEEYYD